MKVGCWKAKADVAGYAAGDAITSCTVDTETVDAAAKFNPIMNSYTGNTGVLYQAKYDTDAGTASAGFGEGQDQNDKAITNAMIAARAVAQSRIWFAGWAMTALEANLVLMGDPSKAPGTQSPDGSYATRVIPMA